MEPGARVLITGATGFVGSHLVDALAGQDVRVRALVRSTSDVGQLERLGIERIEGDLERTEALVRAMHGVRVVCHLAALTRARSADAFHRVNAIGTRNVLEAARDAGASRVVYLSSLAAAGPAVDGPVGPDDPARPLTAYGESKLAGERHCFEAADNLDVAVVRAPAVYGPRDRDLLFFFQAARHGVLPVPTGPARTLQLIHAADLARSLVCAARADATGLYHAAESRAYAWKEVLALIAEAVGRDGRYVPVPASLLRLAGALSDVAARAVGKASIFGRDKVRELLAPAWLCETARAKEALGFEAVIPLRRGLKETASWYREHGWL